MKIPMTPISTRLSGSAKETELRIRNIVQWKKKRPPVMLFLLVALVLMLCFGLFSCQMQEEPPAVDDPAVEQTPPTVDEPVAEDVVQGYISPIENTKVYTVYRRGQDDSAEALEQAALSLAKLYMDDMMTPSDERAFTITEYKDLSVLLRPTAEMDRDTLDLYSLRTSEVSDLSWVVEIDVKYRYEGMISPIGWGEDLPEDQWIGTLYQSSPIGFLMKRTDKTYTLQSRWATMQDSAEPRYERNWPQVLNEMPAVSAGSEIINFFGGDITIILPESWSGKVGYERGDDWITFYHLATRESEGWEGAGVLFTVDWDLGALPLDYPFGTPVEVLASTATAVYMLQLPSDGQCGPETIEEFQSLKLSEVQLVLSDWLLENSVNQFNWVEGTAAVNVNGETFFLYNAESSARLSEIVLSKEYAREVTNFPLAYDIQFWLHGNLYYVNTSAGQLIRQTDTFRSADLTADELQTVVEFLRHTVATQPDLSVILDAYRSVLRGESEFYAPEADQLSNLTEIRNIKSSDFTVVDLDQDGIPEVVVVVDWGTAMASYSIILHYQNGAVYGYTKYIRSFNYLTLKTDGTFSWAGSAFYHGIGRLAFGQKEVVTDKITYMDATVDPVVYVVERLYADADAFDAAYAACNAQPDVTWYDLTKENINTLLTE